MKIHPVVMNWLLFMGLVISSIGIGAYKGDKMISRTIIFAACIVGLCVTNHHKKEELEDEDESENQEEN